MYDLAKTTRLLGSFISSLLIFSACSVPFNVLSMKDDGVSAEYKVRQGDVIEITFEAYPELDQKAVVDSEGTVKLVALGDLKVADLTVTGVERIVSEKYRRIVSQPAITVNIWASNNLSVYIGGEIKRPGVIRFRSDLSIVEGILLAGGLKDRSTGYEVVVFRNNGADDIRVLKFNIKKADPKQNRSFRLAPYDVVFVLKPSKNLKSQRIRI